MDANIHGISKISLGPIGKLNKAENDKTYTRNIYFYADGKEVLEITCFAGGKEKLEIKVQSQIRI